MDREEVQKRIRVDIGGIQNFIFSVYEGEGGGTARTLRARSFFISAFTEYILELIGKKLGVEVNRKENVIFGSGSFEVLLDAKIDVGEIGQRLKELQEKIDTFLLEKLKGTLSVTISLVGGDAEKEFLLEKKRRFSSALENSSKKVWKEKDGIIYLEDEGNNKCPRCRLFFYSENTQDRCNFCMELREVGGKLPKGCSEGKSLKFFKDFVPEGEGLDICNEKIVVPLTTVGKVKELREKIFLTEKEVEELTRNRNDRDEIVAPFTQIVLEAKGDKKLGYLKLDVDNLGRIFFELENFNLRKKLSDFLNDFFKEKVPDIANRFKPENNGLKETTIYILYAGGDDLFAIGPWDKLLDFTVEIYKEFKNWKENRLEKSLKKELENKRLPLTFSSGFVAVKPKFTVRYSAELVDREERNAKENGKNCLSAFNGLIVTWEDLGNLISEARDFADLVKGEKIPRTLFHRFLPILRELGEGKFSSYPYLFYFIGRNVKDKEAKNKLQKLVTGWVNWERNDDEAKRSLDKALFLCTYVLMATRGE